MARIVQATEGVPFIFNSHLKNKQVKLHLEKHCLLKYLKFENTEISLQGSGRQFLAGVIKSDWNFP